MNPLFIEYGFYFLAALAALLIILLFWRRRELRRMRAMEVAREIGPWGFEHLSRLLEAYAVGNYIGQDSVGRVFREIVAELKSGGLPTMLKKIGWKVVEGVFLKNADDRGTLKKLLDVAEKTAAVNEIAPPPPMA